MKDGINIIQAGSLRWHCCSCGAEFLDPALRPVAIGTDDYEDEPCCPRCRSLGIEFEEVKDE